MKQFIQNALGSAGYALVSRNTLALLERQTLSGMLKHAKQCGFNPQTIIDVGAAYGHISKEMSQIFPSAKIEMFEPLVEYSSSLSQVLSELPNARLHPFAAGNREGDITFNVHKDLVGSSLYNEIEGALVDGEPRQVKITRLDSVCASADAPILLKVDVQGAELDVLQGASSLLPKIELIVLEVSLFAFYIGGVQFAEVIAFMKERGFVVYDIFGFLYRPLDDALSQVDIAFAREDSALRKDHRYATPEQRKRQFGIT